MDVNYIKKIRYLSKYRGTREADIIISKYVEWLILNHCDAQLLEALHAILMCDDNDVLAYLGGKPSAIEPHVRHEPLVILFKTWQEEEIICKL